MAQIDDQIKEQQTEIDSLKKELVDCYNSIKDCTESSARQKLFDEKKDIQEDIAQAESDMATLVEFKNSQPSEEQAS
jgi:predicted  nucleic acid-binding Zn-ribbon protein